MQKDQMQTLDEAKDVLKKAGVAEDEMAALERQLLPTNDSSTKDSGRKLGFVSAGLQQNGETTANREDIELPEESDESEDEGEKVEIAQKDVPEAVFGGLVRKRDEEGKEANDAENKESDGNLGALERIKRMRRGA